MSSGLYSHTTRATGTVLSASIYNADHVNHITNLNPSQSGSYSDNVAQMQTATDPGEVASETLASSLAGEIERLRFAIQDIKTQLGFTSPQWYSTPTGSISASGTLQTGMVFPYIGTTAPTGFVMLSGRTIGNAASGATERANADTVTLYTLIWNSMANTEAAVSTGRGANAAADFAANKTINLPDARGRTIYGKDNMGGTTASRITAGISGIDGTILGKAGGDERLHSHSHTGTTGGQNADHSHTIQAAAAGTGVGAGEFIGGAAVTGFETTSGSSNDHNHAFSTAATGAGASQNLSPGLVLNMIAKL